MIWPFWLAIAGVVLFVGVFLWGSWISRDAGLDEGRLGCGWILAIVGLVGALFCWGFAGGTLLYWVFL